MDRSPPKIKRKETRKRSFIQEEDEDIFSSKKLSPKERFVVPKTKSKLQPTPKLEKVSEKHRLLEQLIKRNPKYAQEISEIIEKVDFESKSKSGTISSPRGLKSPSSKKSTRRIKNISPSLKIDLFGAKEEKLEKEKKKAEERLQLEKIPALLITKVEEFNDLIRNPMINSKELIRFYKSNLDDDTKTMARRDYFVTNVYEPILYEKSLYQNRVALLNFLDNDLRIKTQDEQEQKLENKSELFDMFGRKLV